MKLLVPLLTLENELIIWLSTASTVTTNSLSDSWSSFRESFTSIRPEFSLITKVSLQVNSLNLSLTRRFLELEFGSPIIESNELSTRAYPIFVPGSEFSSKSTKSGVFISRRSMSPIVAVCQDLVHVFPTRTNRAGRGFCLSLF
ncbi:hypothetical protein BpHYR1_008156 [Brachionus plicatilis]|uniref:Uncharacterized protein n=1 Tax=Brachionus plicatilis TaxID=10195 RepID=A0A3M7PR90_BRAPC|nr:hypothetical protein BpHYR1_008156 [Brachionus plicatilis]